MTTARQSLGDWVEATLSVLEPPGLPSPERLAYSQLLREAPLWTSDQWWELWTSLSRPDLLEDDFVPILAHHAIDMVNRGHADDLVDIMRTTPPKMTDMISAAMVIRALAKEFDNPGAAAALALVLPRLHTEHPTDDLPQVAWDSIREYHNQSTTRTVPSALLAVVWDSLPPPARIPALLDALSSPPPVPRCWVMDRLEEVTPDRENAQRAVTMLMECSQGDHELTTLRHWLPAIPTKDTAEVLAKALSEGHNTHVLTAVWSRLAPRTDPMRLILKLIREGHADPALMQSLVAWATTHTRAPSVDQWAEVMGTMMWPRTPIDPQQLSALMAPLIPLVSTQHIVELIEGTSNLRQAPALSTAIINLVHTLDPHTRAQHASAWLAPACSWSIECKNAVKAMVSKESLEAAVPPPASPSSPKRM